MDDHFTIGHCPSSDWDGARQLFSCTDLQARPKVVPSLTTRDIPRLGVKFPLPSGVSGSGSFTWEPFVSRRASRYSAMDATAPTHPSLGTPGCPQAARVRLRHFLALSYHGLLPP
jgi:hypothetical protein